MFKFQLTDGKFKLKRRYAKEKVRVGDNGWSRFSIFSRFRTPEYWFTIFDFSDLLKFLDFFGRWSIPSLLGTIPWYPNNFGSKYYVTSSGIKGIGLKKINGFVGYKDKIVVFKLPIVSDIIFFAFQLSECSNFRLLSNY